MILILCVEHVCIGIRSLELHTQGGQPTGAATTLYSGYIGNR